MRVLVRAALAAVAVLTIAVVGVARAGTYVINDCPSSPAATTDSGPWTVYGGPQADKGACSAGPGDWIGPLGGSMGPATLDGVTVAVPSGSGITIREAKVWWAVPSSTSGATTFAIASTNNGTVGTAATPLDRSATPDDFVLPSSSTSFVLADYCSNDDAGAGCTFGAGENANLQLFGAQLTLSDSNLPSGAVTGGALAGGGPVSATQSLAFNAADADSGVRLAQLIVDGQIAAQHDYLASCPYTNLAACPTTRSDTLEWNTAGVGNGSHDLALRVVNAAGESATIDDHTVTTANSVVPHIPNGTPCAGEQLSIKVARKRQVTVGYGRRIKLTGSLHCSSTPIARARVLIGGGGLHASAVTDSDGHFTYLLPRGHSRALDVSYTAFSDDPRPVAVAHARVNVRPSIKLKITPSRTHNDGTIMWRGQINGGPYPHQGIPLQIQVREGRRWQTFDEIITRRGRIAYRYTFRRTIAATTYSFRVSLPSGGAVGYPYASGASRAIRVRVS
jgi:hypothetical protein